VNPIIESTEGQNWDKKRSQGDADRNVVKPGRSELDAFVFSRLAHSLTSTGQPPPPRPTLLIRRRELVESICQIRERLDRLGRPRPLSLKLDDKPALSLASFAKPRLSGSQLLAQSGDVCF
jgi:hypothetical protein